MQKKASAKVMKPLLYSLERYWNYLRQGKNPFLDFHLIQAIDERVQSVSEEDLARLRVFFIELYDDDHVVVFLLIQTLFRLEYTEIYKEEYSFS